MDRYGWASLHCSHPCLLCLSMHDWEALPLILNQSCVKSDRKNLQKLQITDRISVLEATPSTINEPIINQLLMLIIIFQYCENSLEISQSPGHCSVESDKPPPICPHPFESLNIVEAQNNPISTSLNPLAHHSRSSISEHWWHSWDLLLILLDYPINAKMFAVIWLY